jgi:hypothetical protein
LLAAAVIGLRARGAFAHRANFVLTDAGGRVVTSVFAAAEGVALVTCVVVLALLLRRPRRRKHDDDEAYERYRPPIPWWAKTLITLFALAMLVTPWIILLTARTRKGSASPALTGPSLPLPGRTGHPIAPSQGSLVWPLLAGAAIAVAALLTLAVLSRRRRQREDARTPNRALGVTPLADGLAAGHDALLAGGEPRKAIIACYAAMERGFAKAGSAPAAADTPAEVLARATEAGIVRSGSAEALTGLFRRARYSSEPMTGVDSGAAAAALAQMRADLESLRGSADLESRAGLGSGP